MATFVQAATVKTNTGTAPGSTITSNSLTTTVGNAILIAATAGGVNPASLTLPSDNASNTITRDFHVIDTPTGTLATSIASGNILVGGAGHTGSYVVGSGGGGLDNAIVILEYSGISTPAAATNTASGTASAGGTVNGGSVTGGTNDLFMGVLNNAGNNVTITPNGSWVQRADSRNGATAQPINVIELVGNGAQNSSWTIGSAVDWSAGTAVYTNSTGPDLTKGKADPTYRQVIAAGGAY